MSMRGMPSILRAVLLSSAILCGASAAADCFIQERDGGVVMGNAYCSLTFKPRGGACVSFVYGGKEFTSGRGMLEDLFFETPNYGLGEFVNAPYQYEILDKGPKKASLRLWGRGSGPMALVEYSKTITIYDDSSLVRAAYEIRNLPESMGEASLTPWSHNTIGIADEDCTYYIPRTSGVAAYPHDRRSPLGNLYTADVARGWTGVIGKSGTGLAATFDYRYLKQVYNCFSKSEVSVEWMLGPVRIKNGDSFKTLFTFHPFSGIDRLDGVSKDAVGGIDVDAAEGAVTIRLSASKAVKGKAILEFKAMPADGWTELGATPVALATGKSMEAKLPCKMDKDGTYVFRCRLLDEGGASLLEFERPFTKGVSSGVYELKPDQPKLIKEQRNYCEFKLREDVVTPHVKWAKPYAKGKVKALFLIDALRLREVVELSQRMDLECVTPTLLPGGGTDRYWNVGWHHAVGGWSDGVKEMDPILAGDYECVVVSGFHHAEKSWPGIAAKTVERLLPKINAGTGLVYIGPRDLTGRLKELYDAASPAGETHPVLSSGFIVPGVGRDKVRTVEYGRGRIVFLGYDGSPITPHGIRWPHEFNYWEYAFSFIAKTVLWASRKEPAISMESCSVENEVASATVSGNGAGSPLVMELTAFDKDGVVDAHLVKRLDSQAAGAKIQFDIPPLKNGPHFFGFQLKSLKGEVMDWTTRRFDTSNFAGMSNLKLESDYCREGETLNVETSIASSRKEPLDFEIRASWLDAHGRVAGRTACRASAGRVQMSIPIDKSYSVFNRVVVSLSAEGRELDVKERTFFIHVPPERRWNDYEILLWHHSRNDALPAYLHYYYTAQTLKRIGVDSMFGYSPLPVLAAGMDVYITGLYRQNLDAAALKEGRDTMIRKPCLSDPAFLAKVGAALEGCAREWRKYSPTLYGIGDENSLTSYESECDVCISKHCLPRFQKWLISQYGDLGQLNSAWGTQFSRLEDVRPLNYKQAIERKDMNFSPWADHRTFMDGVFSDAMRLCKGWLKGVDSGTAVGECGTSRQSTYGAWDWRKRLQVWEALQPYSRYGEQLEIQRSFFRGNMAGYTGYREGKFGVYCNWWRGLLNGETGASVWFTPLVLNPDFTNAALGKAIEEYAKGELKKGVGRLVSKSERLHDGIAIHYSQPSLQCAYALKSPFGYDSLKQYYDNQQNWMRLLEGAGLQYKFVASDQIESGALAGGEFKMLLLPLSRALSDKEADAIRAFANKGGIVIADCQTGLFDEHAKFRGEGVLDSFFGVKRLETPPLVKPVSLNQNGSPQFNCCDPVLAKDTQETRSVKETAGSGREFPALLVKGKAVYLNVLPAGSPKADAAIQDMLGRFVQAKVRVDKDGATPPGLEIARFKCGDAELVGIFQDPQSIRMDPANFTREQMLAKGVQANVAFPGKHYVYDIRRGAFLGERNSVETLLAPGEALLYALCPYRLDGVDVKPDRNEVAQGDWLEARISRIPAKGSGVARVEVVDPDGTLADCYSENVDLKDGKGALRIKTAFNDKPGTWTVRVKDILSGCESSSSFTMKLLKR